jgi:hypothetical protein
VQHADRLLSLSVDTAADPGRARWALAHTVVALAAAHDVDTVQVEGWVWSRERGADAWVAVSEPADGGVTVRLAGADGG